MAKVGTVACLVCGESIPVKGTAGGGVSVCCPWCDVSAYAKAGTEAARIIKGKMKPDAAPNDPPAAEKQAAPVAKPVPMAKPKPASMAGLLIG